ncbi:hypothetical protein C8F01DRAFT_1049209 [Mycena amicta]|nr:hypothetical protein C8F01DRAFT_1049209 [Mycena amicta]
MSEAPPLKRRREDEDVPPAAIVRSPDYWFDDGSIILQVQTTQYRVAKSMLAMHSTVFRDMFTVPLPPDDPLVDTCPVVVLSGDTAEDWEHLLAAMYPKSCVHDQRQPIASISALLRLSKKYDIPVFRRQWLARLKEEFPTTLEGYEETEGTADGWMYLRVEKIPRSNKVSCINLARELGLFSILPACFYALTWHNFLDPSPAAEELSLSDQAAFLRGQLRLLRLQSETTMKWLHPDDHSIPCAGCASHAKCRNALRNILSSGFLTDIEHRTWVFGPWLEEWNDGLCEPCQTVAKSVYEAGRSECWRQLPSIFGLPDWKELKKLDFE